MTHNLLTGQDDSTAQVQLPRLGRIFNLHPVHTEFQGCTYPVIPDHLVRGTVYIKFKIMSKIDWEVKTLQQLTVEQLFEILQLRVDVFVVEQHCAYRELDEYDQHPGTRHLSGRNEGGELIAYARILPPGLCHPEVNVGRFVVKADLRQQGIGHQLLQTTLQEIAGWWPEMPIKMSAQTYLHRFYAQYGFTQVSDGYLEDGIPHVEMVKEG